MLRGPENRFWRTQASGPRTMLGGGAASSCWERTKRRVWSAASVAVPVTVLTGALPLSFHDRHAAIVDIHDGGGGQADGQVHRHGDGDDLDRLPGLGPHRAPENLDQGRVGHPPPRRGGLC